MNYLESVLRKYVLFTLLFTYHILWLVTNNLGLATYIQGLAFLLRQLLQIALRHLQISRHSRHESSLKSATGAVDSQQYYTGSNHISSPQVVLQTTSPNAI